MSKFITHPSIIDKGTDITITIVDPTEVDIENVGLFCKVSNKEYDIYLYNSNYNDNDWLNSIVRLSDIVLINESSKYAIANSIAFGKKSAVATPLDYLQNIDDPSDNI